MARQRYKPTATPTSVAPPPEVLAMLERYPQPTLAQAVWRHCALAGVAAFGMYGLVAQNWDVGPTLAFFGAEFFLIVALHWLSIAFLPVAMASSDRDYVRGVVWLFSVLALLLLLYLAVEGWQPFAAAVSRQGGKLAGYFREHGLLWPVLGMYVVLLLDYCHEIALWRRRGGAFYYWPGVNLVARLWFCLAFGIFLYMLFFVVSVGSDNAGAFVWLLFTLADLFALWLPELLRRKVRKEGHIT